MTPWTVQALLSTGFPRQEYWSGLPFPPPGDLPDPGMEVTSPALQADSVPLVQPGKSLHSLVVVVHLLSRVLLFATLWTATCQAPLSFTISWSLLKFMSTESDSIQPSYPLPPISLPALSLSQHQGLFQRVLSSHQVAKLLELQHQPFQ